jgi:ATP-dependent RNA helicase RhlE
MTPLPTGAGFDDLGIAPKLLDILQKLKFVTPTPIQRQSIPSAIEGKDLMGIAQTGTGKTLAFGIPMIQRLAQSQGKSKGLIILPTRELALQVNETLKKIGGNVGLKTAILIGGESMHKQLKMLSHNPHIIIATPGRLIDHMESGRVKLDTTKILVLDEADRMLDMGFAPQIKKILQRVPKDRQTMLFSATMPDEIVNIAKSYMNLPLRVEVAPAGTAIELVTQEVFFVGKQDKLSLLQKLLADYNGSVLIFSRTKHGAKKIAKITRDMGHKAAEIHSNRSLNQRLEALEGFKIGRYRVLVATDIAARGIDVTGIQLVINYDLPDNAEDYVHRIGRTGRAGATGHAISFATPDQRHDVKAIERLIRMALPIAPTPAYKDLKPVPRSAEPMERPYAPRGGYQGRNPRSSSRGPSSRSSFRPRNQNYRRGTGFHK